MNQALFYILLLGFASSHIPLNAQTLSDDGNSNAIYEASCVFQYGGESKLTLVPKFNVVRMHQRKKIKPYYGIEVGVHPMFVSGAYTFAGVAGAELNSFHLESSLSHFRTTKINNGNDEFSGPFIQNSVNLKVGYRISTVVLKLGTSFLVQEMIPFGDERIPLLDLGKINDTIFGIEIQIKLG